MKLSDALAYQKEIEKAADHLNRLMQGASIEGLSCEAEFIPFKHTNGRVFDIVQVTTKINPSDLEI